MSSWHHLKGQISATVESESAQRIQANAKLYINSVMGEVTPKIVLELRKNKGKTMSVKHLSGPNELGWYRHTNIVDVFYIVQR